MARRVYQMCSDGEHWREMARPNPTSILARELRQPGDVYTDALGFLYRLTVATRTEES